MSADMKGDNGSSPHPSLQGYNQITAVSQIAINLCLDHQHKIHPECEKVDIENPKDRTALRAYLDIPKVELSASDEPQYGGTLLLKFQSGEFFYHDSSGNENRLVSIPVQGWIVGIDIRFHSQHLIQHVPAEIRKTIERPGNYTVSQLIIDFSNAYLATGVWIADNLFGINLAEGDSSNVKNLLKSLFESHIETLKGPGNHNILRYPITAASPTAPTTNATIPPTSVRLQTMYYKSDGQNSKSEGKNAFLIKEMTHRYEMPAKDLTWTANWFNILNGLFCLSSRIFVEGYLQPRLMLYNKSMIFALNSAMPWTLTPLHGPSNDEWKLSFYPPPEHRDLHFNHEGLFTWSQDVKGAEEADAPPWFVGYLYYNIHIKSTIWTKMHFIASSGKVIIQTTADIFHDQDLYHYNNHKDHTSTKVTVEWSNTLEIVGVLATGKLKFRITPSKPVCTAIVSELKWGLWQLNNWMEINEDHSKEVEKTVTDKLISINFTKSVAEDLNSDQNGFFLPGAAVFDMKNPVFSQNRDLYVGLTYRNGS